MSNPTNQSLNSTERTLIEASQVSDFNNLVARYVVNAVFSITAFTGNGLVLGTIWKTPSLQSPSNILLFGLALSDFGVGLIVQPLYVICLILEIITKNYLFALWTAYRATQAVFVSATVLTLTAVSVDRFLALYLHLRYPAVVTGKRTLIVLLVIWITSVAYALTLVTHMNLHRAFCIIVVSSCLIVNSLVYVMIFRIARHHRNQTQDQARIYGDEVLNKKRQRKSAISMFVVFLLLCICYFPYLCVRIAMIRHALWHPSVVRLAVSWSGVIVYINSSLNPLVYCWRMRDLRKAMKDFAKNFLLGNNW